MVNISVHILIVAYLSVRYFIIRFSSLALVRQLKDDMHANYKLQRMVLDFNWSIPSPIFLLYSTKIYQGQGYL